ncbi:MAG: L-glutamate gamma-semialdehyde dehydrogenase [Myxococcota bacterium]|nr:L-glutamate gamma-semialdehyde dehydrogenase [Myxococcota bacterium]
MISANRTVPAPRNEPVWSYAPETSERQTLKAAVASLRQESLELKSVVDGKHLSSSETVGYSAPHNHKQNLATLHRANEDQIQGAIESALRAKKHWANIPYEERAVVFLKAADLLTGRFRDRANAATMLGQSKTAHQSEIDTICELADFWRFNVQFGQELLANQPYSSPGVWNQLDYRPLDGFILAVSPFNFSAIAGNLASTPALLGNTVVWKPAESQALSAQIIMDILIEAGLPPGVINMVHGPGRVVGDLVVNDPRLGGVHFTGSTPTFQNMWNTVGQNISKYHCYPRLVGETGGKDFIVAHPSADLRSLTVAAIRGAFEYQGQKCSAASRLYVPESMWPALRDEMAKEIAALKVGDVEDFTNFMGAVISRKSFDKIKSYIDYAKESSDAEIIIGGECDDSVGYFIQPTVVLTTNPKFKLLQEEIFGPVLTVYQYPDNKFSEVLTICDEGSPYALTGAIFAQDKHAVLEATSSLRYAAGNFCINDKPTAAVVGQQPFGGGRASGTNDKAGSIWNLIRWVSPRTIKETFDAPRVVDYPFMGAK